MFESTTHLSVLLEKVRYILDAEDNQEDGRHKNSETEAEESEVEGLSAYSSMKFCKNLQAHLMCLTDLTPTLEQVADDLDLSGREPACEPAKVDFHVTNAAKQYVAQIRDKFRNAPQKLVERLGEANWQRRTRIQSQMQGRPDEVEYGETEHAIARSTFAPVSKFHDSGLGSSLPTHSRIAASVASHTSFLSSQADGEAGRLRVPPTPAEILEGTSFECFICKELLSKLKNRVDWK